MDNIPGKTKIQSIELRVRDLDNSLEFYSGLFGLKIIRKELSESLLSATGEEPYIVKLIQDKSAPLRMKGTPGLFHMAFLLPDRKELARVFIRLFENNIKFQGFSDHLVSEAIYLSDPDGNGLEIYTDKPRNQWQESHGQILMDTLPLDLSIVTKELDDPEKWDGIHPDTILGHIHLNVSDLNKAEEFYNEILGFRITNSQFPKALFYGAGGYHHHIATNTWLLDRKVKSNRDSLGMISYTMKIPDKVYLDNIESKLKEEGMSVAKNENGLTTKDFDNNNIHIVI